MIRTIKLIHTIIWAIMALACFYILYAGITNTFDIFLYLALFLLLIESTVLIFNKWTCPLTPWARKYTDKKEDNFDIYLPNWLAKHNKIIFGIIFVVGLFLVCINLFKQIFNY